MRYSNGLAERARNAVSRVGEFFAGKNANGYGTATNGAGRNKAITDPKDLDSEKYDNEPYFPTELETALAQLLETRMKASATQRKPFEARYKENLRFRFLNDQWGQVTPQNGYQSLMKPGDYDRVYSTSNKIRSICRKHEARLLGTDVKISITGLTGRDKDIACAKQARSLDAHFEQVQDDDGFKQKALEEGIGIGLVWRYDYWDPTVIVPVPVYDELTGDIADVEWVKGGDCCYEMLSFADVYIDPRCRNLDLSDAQWVIIACQMSLPAICARWPEMGPKVKGQSGSEDHDALRLDLDNITANGNQDETSRQVATVLTLWEQPTKKHPNGLYAVCAGGVCLEQPRPWPYTEMRDPQRGNRFEFPVTAWGFDRGIESFWPDGLTSVLVDIQRRRNRYISKADNHTKNGDGKILSPRGAEISPDAFKSGRPNEIIEWTVDPELFGAKPELFQTPPLDPSIPLCINIADQDLADAGEVQAVDMGKVPSGTPGIVVNALLDASQSGVVISQKSWETFCETFHRKRLALAKQYYKFDRFLFTQDTAPPSLIEKQAKREMMQMNPQMGMGGTQSPIPNMGGIGGSVGAPPPGFGEGMDDAPDPEEPGPRAQAMAFTDLAEGRYVVKATSSPPRNPSAVAQLVVEFMQAGAFLPQNLPGTYLAFRTLELVQGEKWVDDFFYAAEIEKNKALREQQEQQAHEAAIQEANQAAIAEQQARLLQTQQGMKQAELQADAQKTAATLQAQAAMGAAESQARGATQIEVEKQRNENALQQEVVRAVLTPPKEPEKKPGGKKK